MNDNEPNISIPVDLTNPGQFFACCGLLELADRLWPGVEGCFAGSHFCISNAPEITLATLLDSLHQSSVANTMATVQQSRLELLSSMSKKQRKETPGLEDEKKTLETRRREEPILLQGQPLQGQTPLRLDWFRDDAGGGSRFKTWAGQQSVLDITVTMHDGMRSAHIESEATLWNNARGIGLPFNFDSDLGGQGSALDIGFSFDALAGSEATRIVGTCKPALELLCFIGLQRFRPRELAGQKRFVYAAWQSPLPVSVAAAAACQSIRIRDDPRYEFRLLYRTKYLKSFLPAIPFQGDRDE